MKQAFFDIIAERLKNAFLANFVMSWILVNHSILLYLLISEDKPDIKLDFINSLKFNVLSDFLYPLFLVLLYVYVLPMINLVLMRMKLKFVSPLLSKYKNDEQDLYYTEKILIEDKRLDLVFREKEKNIEFEELRTNKQILRTKSAESEALFYRQKQESEEKALKLEKEKLLELEKVVKLEQVIEKQRVLDEREKLLNIEKERLVNERLKYDMGRSQAQWIEVDKVVSVGDRVFIDFIGSINGEEFKGGKAEMFPLEIGDGRMIPGFEDGIVGHKKDDEFVVDIKFPDNYHADNLKGKEAEFTIKIKKVESRMIQVN